MLKTICLTVALAGASAHAASDGDATQPFEIRLEGTQNGQNFPFLKIHVRRDGKDEGYANVRFPETIAGLDVKANQWLKFYQDLRSPVWPAKLECEPVDLPPKWEGDDHKQAYTMRLDNGMVLEAKAEVHGSEVRLSYELENGTELDLRGVRVWSCIQGQLMPNVNDPLMERTFVVVNGQPERMRDHVPAFKAYTVAESVNKRFTAYLDGVDPNRENPVVSPHPGFPDDPAQAITFWHVVPPIDAALIATESTDGAWTMVTRSDVAREVWMNPGISCHHADAAVPTCAPGETIRIENRIVYLEGGAKAVPGLVE